MSAYGPNVTKLITKFIARAAIPPGGGFADGVEFFRNPERRKQALAQAEADALKAIGLIKAAPDNPVGEDDEEVAGWLLKEIKKHLPGRGEVA